MINSMKSSNLTAKSYLKIKLYYSNACIDLHLIEDFENSITMKSKKLWDFCSLIGWILS